MNIAFVISRIALVAIFLVSGIFHLMDRGQTAALIQSKVAIPPALADAAAQAEAATGMSTFELLAIAVGIIAIVFSLLIMFGIATRLSALVLLVYTAIAAYSLYDFWNMTGELRSLNMTMLLMSLSIMGGLLMLFVIGPWQPGMVDDDYGV